MTIQIREIRHQDAKAIAVLSKVLGYEVEEVVIEEQIGEILEGRGNMAFMATHENRVIGYIHVFKAVRLTTKPFMEIGALVVAPDHRRKGIARSLVGQAEKVAGSEMKLRVRCNVKREEAHQFYESIGFLPTKNQRIFEKG